MSIEPPLKRAFRVLGGQAATARLLSVSGGMVWQWQDGRRPFPPEHAGLLETATTEAGEAVTAEELCPGVTFERDAAGRVIHYVVPVRVAPAGDGANDDPDAGRLGPPVETA